MGKYCNCWNMELCVHTTPCSGVSSHCPTVLTKENVFSLVLSTSDPLVLRLMENILKEQKTGLMAGCNSLLNARRCIYL